MGRPVADAGSDYKPQSVEQLGKMRQRHSALTGLGRERPHSDLVHISRRAQHHNGYRRATQLVNRLEYLSRVRGTASTALQVPA